MKNRSRYFLYLIACAYVFLAVVSLTTELPTRTVNCFALGAVLFSVAELIQSISDRDNKLRIRDFASKKDSLVFCKEYLEKALRSRFELRKPGKTYYVVFFLYSLASICIIAYPYASGMGFLKYEKVGIFCTILSLGLILLSRFISDTIVEIDEDKNLIDAFDAFLTSSVDELKSAVEKQTELVTELEKRVGTLKAEEKNVSSNEQSKEISKRKRRKNEKKDADS